MKHLNFGLKSYLIMIVALAGILATADALQGKAPEKKLNVHVAWPATNFHTEGVMAFAELVKTRSKETIQFHIHPGGSIGLKGAEVLRAVRQGAVPAAEVLMGNVEGENPIFGLTSLPLVARDFSEAKALYEQSRPLYEKAAAKSGTVLLYAAPWPPGGIYSKEKITSAQDLENLKIRTYDANSASFAHALGAKGLAIPFAELYTALSTGMVKGVLTSSVTGVDAKLWEVTDHFLKINYAYPLNMMVIRKSEFDNLSEKSKALIMEAAKETEKNQWRRVQKEDAEALKMLAAKGIVVSNKVPNELAVAMEKAAADMRHKWLEKLSATERKTLTFPGSTSH
jgi:TRAP-type C4-dicarboxylate transport system substrate-binding protein